MDTLMNNRHIDKLIHKQINNRHIDRHKKRKVTHQTIENIINKTCI